MSRPSFLPERAWRTGPLDLPAAVVAPEPQPVLGERLLDLLDRLLAEVRDRAELVLGLRDEVADRLDADALEAVVRTDAELELLDREVLHAVRELDVDDGAAVELLRLGVEALHALEVGEDRKLADQDLCGLGDRVLRLDGAVRRYVEDQLVVVGA